MGLLSLALKIAFIALLIIGLLVGGIVFYFYNYHVFKTVTICVPQTAMNSSIPCNNNVFCQNVFMTNITNMGEDYNKSPAFVREMVSEVLNESIYCQDNCFIKQIYGDMITPEFSGECQPGHKAVTKDIHGKEGLEFLSYVKERVTPE